MASNGWGSDVVGGWGAMDTEETTVQSTGWGDDANAASDVGDDAGGDVADVGGGGWASDLQKEQVHQQNGGGSTTFEAAKFGWKGGPISSASSQDTPPATDHHQANVDELVRWGEDNDSWVKKPAVKKRANNKPIGPFGSNMESDHQHQFAAARRPVTPEGMHQPQKNTLQTSTTTTDVAGGGWGSITKMKTTTVQQSTGWGDDANTAADVNGGGSGGDSGWGGSDVGAGGWTSDSQPEKEQIQQTQNGGGSTTFDATKFGWKGGPISSVSSQGAGAESAKKDGSFVHSIQQHHDDSSAESRNGTQHNVDELLQWAEDNDSWDKKPAVKKRATNKETAAGAVTKSGGAFGNGGFGSGRIRGARVDTTPIPSFGSNNMSSASDHHQFAAAGPFTQDMRQPLQKNIVQAKAADGWGSSSEGWGSSTTDVGGGGWDTTEMGTMMPTTGGGWGEKDTSSTTDDNNAVATTKSQSAILILANLPPASDERWARCDLRTFVNNNASPPRSMEENVVELCYEKNDPFAFVKLSSFEAASRACVNLNGSNFFGRKIIAGLAPMQFEWSGGVNNVSANQIMNNNTAVFVVNQPPLTTHQLPQQQQNGWNTIVPSRAQPNVDELLRWSEDNDSWVKKPAAVKKSAANKRTDEAVDINKPPMPVGMESDVNSGSWGTTTTEMKTTVQQSTGWGDDANAASDVGVGSGGDSGWGGSDVGAGGWTSDSQQEKEQQNGGGGSTFDAAKLGWKDGGPMSFQQESRLHPSVEELLQWAEDNDSWDKPAVKKRANNKTAAGAVTNKSGGGFGNGGFVSGGIRGARVVDGTK